MNIYDIDLPPLPEWMRNFQIPADDQDDSDFNWLDWRMKAYARAAIEPYQRRIAELESQLEAIGAGGVTQGQRLTGDRQRRGEPWKHDLYQTGDSGAPDQIKDGNGDVVLDLCKRCGKAEIELTEPCTAPQPAEPTIKEPLTVAESMIDARDAAKEKS